MDQTHFFAQISDYLDGHLSEHDQAAFERRLADDDALAREIALHREVQKELGNRKVHDFRQKLEEINATGKVAAADDIPLRPVGTKRRLFAVAAGLALLVIAGLWWFSQSGSPQEVLAAHLRNFDPASVLPPEYFNNRSRDSSAPVISEKTLQDSARILFSEKKYEAALALMQQVNQADVVDLSAFYYELGILYLINDQPAPAIEAHQKMENDKSGGKYWYLALSHLDLGQTNACREQLLKLTEMENPWSDDAKELLRKLP